MKHITISICMLSMSLLVNAQGTIGIGGGSSSVDGLEFNWTIGSLISQQTFSSDDLMITQSALGFLPQSVGGGETSIEEQYSGQLNVYPNPSSDCVNISFGNDVQMFDLLLYTPQGQRLLDRKINGASSQLNLSHYSAGMYILILKVGHQSISRPLLIK